MALIPRMLPRGNAESVAAALDRQGLHGLAVVDFAYAPEKGRRTARVVLDRGLKVAGLRFLSL